jgi:MFS transporter, MHS family, proline/betaine transporter
LLVDFYNEILSSTLRIKIVWEKILFSALRKDQKEAVGLLQIGTFLEYFDLMLYVHMAVLLNELFFPKTDPHTAALISAFAFCSTYILRPFGALVFGWMGDHIGRKTTVIITTMMMATSCIIMANLPTYSQIGITAAWVVTICRVLQGLSSMGEIIGAEIYVTEITTPPERYPLVALIGCSARLGTMAALGMATLVTSLAFNWRAAFLGGAIIAIIGTLARTRLRETPDFVDKKKRILSAIKESQKEGLGKPAELLNKTNVLWKEKVPWKTSLAFLMISSGPPMCLYFSYVYCGSLLKDIGFAVEQIISQNFMVSTLEFLGILLTVFLSAKIFPLKILKFKGILFLGFLLLVPFFLSSASNSFVILLIQFVSVLLTLTGVPAVAVLIVKFPVFRRFTYTSFIYAISRSVMYVVTSFGLVYLTSSFGPYGLWAIMLPMSVGFLWGVYHFENLEETEGEYQNMRGDRFRSKVA